MINLEILWSYFAWILPSIFGSIIGYITTDTAIKMLFRPLKAKHIGPIKLPFTPGIIPRQRDKLAESIGLMVSRELITEDAIRRQISSPTFKETLCMRVREFTGFVVYTPYSQLQEKFRQGRSKVVERPKTEEQHRGEDRDKPADTIL